MAKPVIWTVDDDPDVLRAVERDLRGQYGDRYKIISADSGASAWYLRFEVLDVPGVLAEIAGRLSEANVSIESMIQRGRAPGEHVSIVMITHECPQQAVERALKAIAVSDKVRARPCMIPMEAA